MGLSSLASSHNLIRNKLWQKQSARLRCIPITPPLFSSPSAACSFGPSDFFFPLTGHFYLLWNFTLTSHNLQSAGNTKATFQSASTFPWKITVCLVTSPFHTPPPPSLFQEINSSSEKSNNLQYELLHRKDLMIPFCSIRHLEDEVSLFLQASSLVIVLPEADENRQGVLRGAQHMLCFNKVLDLTAILTKQKSNLS